MSDVDIDELRRRVNAAAAAMYDAERSARELRDRLMDQARKEAEAQYGAALEAVRQEWNAARSALKDAEDSRRLENADPPYPVGTRLRKWNYAGKYSQHRVRTEQIGVIEIVQRDFVMPGNMREYRRTNVGDVIVRLLKKDGSPSSKFERWGSRAQYDWRPEDEK